MIACSKEDVFDTIGQKRYKTRLNDVQKDTIEGALSELHKITEKENRLKTIFNKKMVQSRDELCAEMNKLSLQKSVIQSHATDVVTMSAVKLVVPLNSRKVRRIIDQQKKAVVRPRQPNRVCYTQKILTVYLVKQYCENGKYSIRKAVALYKLSQTHSGVRHSRKSGEALSCCESISGRVTNLGLLVCLFIFQEFLVLSASCRYTQPEGYLWGKCGKMYS